MQAGYTVTAHLNLDGKVIFFVQMIYYPTDEGQAGYVHYIGRLDGETLKPVDEWHLMPLGADKAFRGLMSANNIPLESALITVLPAAPAAEGEPVAAPVVTPAPVQTSYLIPAVLASILLFVGASFILRRRAVGHPTV
jgi:hypothetical protein